MQDGLSAYETHHGGVDADDGCRLMGIVSLDPSCH
jgi:hypothetical protein